MKHVFHGLKKADAEGQTDAVTASVHEPVQRPETGHWYCDITFDGLPVRYETHHAADDAEQALQLALESVRDTLRHENVSVDGPMSALPEKSARHHDFTFGDLSRHLETVVICGEGIDGSGERKEIVSRIYPPVPIDPSTVGCILSLDDSSDDRVRLFGITYTQARELCFRHIEHWYRKRGIRRIR